MSTELLDHIKVMGDRVLIRPIEVADKSQGGILIPPQGKDAPQEGEVVAVGGGTNPDVPMDCQKGDRIFFAANFGLEIKVEDVKYLLIDQHVIMGVARDN